MTYTKNTRMRPLGRTHLNQLKSLTRQLGSWQKVHNLLLQHKWTGSYNSVIRASKGFRLCVEIRWPLEEAIKMASSPEILPAQTEEPAHDARIRRAVEALTRRAKPEHADVKALDERLSRIEATVRELLDALGGLPS